MGRAMQVMLIANQSIRRSVWILEVRQLSRVVQEVK